MFNKLVSGAFALASLLTAPALMAASTYYETAVPGGMLTVNQTSGTITYCSGLISGNTNKPMGKCAVLGTISPVNLLGNLQVVVGSTANDVAFISNNATGSSLQCGLMVNDYSGAPYGGCVAVQAN